MVKQDCAFFAHGGCVGLNQTYCKTEDNCRFYKSKEFYEKECERLYGKDWNKKKPKKKKSDLDEFIQLKELGYSYGEIATMTGYCYKTVYDRLNREVY